jgi:hypothetical protein
MPCQKIVGGLLGLLFGEREQGNLVVGTAASYAVSA